MHGLCMAQARCISNTDFSSHQTQKTSRRQTRHETDKDCVLYAHVWPTINSTRFLWTFQTASLQNLCIHLRECWRRLSIRVVSADLHLDHLGCNAFVPWHERSNLIDEAAAEQAAITFKEFMLCEVACAVWVWAYIVAHNSRLSQYALSH